MGSMRQGWPARGLRSSGRLQALPHDSPPSPAPAAPT